MYCLLPKLQGKTRAGLTRYFAQANIVLISLLKQTHTDMYLGTVMVQRILTTLVGGLIRRWHYPVGRQRIADLRQQIATVVSTTRGAGLLILGNPI